MLASQKGCTTPSVLYKVLGSLSISAAALATGMASRKHIKERRVMRLLALSLCCLADHARHPNRMKELLHALCNEEEVIPDADVAELELVAREVECIASGGDPPTVAQPDG